MADGAGDSGAGVLRWRLRGMSPRHRARWETRHSRLRHGDIPTQCREQRLGPPNPSALHVRAVGGKRIGDWGEGPSREGGGGEEGGVFSQNAGGWREARSQPHISQGTARISHVHMSTDVGVCTRYAPHNPWENHVHANLDLL